MTSRDVIAVFGRSRQTMQNLGSGVLQLDGTVRNDALQIVLLTVERLGKPAGVKQILNPGLRLWPVERFLEEVHGP